MAVSVIIIITVLIIISSSTHNWLCNAPHIHRLTSTDLIHNFTASAISVSFTFSMCN